MFCGLMELRDQLGERARARRDMTIKLVLWLLVNEHDD
jgi:hypothetical protein